MTTYKPFDLRPPQHPMVNFIADHKRCSLWAGMGIGKSSAALFALDLLKMINQIGDSPTLIIGPMRVARDTWPTVRSLTRAPRPRSLTPFLFKAALTV